MNPFKTLASQTAVYGLGTIVPRMLNYMLVPLYTRVFVAEIYGEFTELYAWIGLFLALLTYGMETSFFRFSQKEDYKKVFAAAEKSILFTTAIFLLIMAFVFNPVANAMGYAGKGVYILFTGIIVACDAISAVPFALLRQQNKAGKFALIKILNVCINVASVLFFLLVIPDKCTQWAHEWFGPECGLITWVFIANILASFFNILILSPEFKHISFKWNKEDSQLLKEMLNYGLPILLISLIGMVNEVADKIVLKYLVADKSMAKTMLGIYGANYKLAVMMTIFIQMFRYASEPFFFSKAKDKNSPQLFADVMTYFVIFGLLIFLLITLYIDIFDLFIGRKGSDYHEGLGIVPIVLIANLFYGIVFNLSIWYKLTDNTRKGSVITGIGAAVTIVCLVGLIPLIGYWGAAIAHLACYTTMMVVSFIWGQKVFPIPYNLKRIFFYLILALGLYAVSTIFHPQVQWISFTLNTLYLLLFVGIAYKLDLKNALRG